MNDILDLLNQGLQKSGSLRTAETLGDRSAYIGMSDIAKAADCLRAAVAGKLQMPKTSGICKSLGYQDYSQLQRELRLQRGHWFEAGAADAFKSTGRHVLHQLGIQTMRKGVPIIAHPDFVFVNEGGDIQVVELKSCEQIPETAYASHEVQLFGQMGLLASCWQHPCFFLGQPEQQLVFSNMVKKELGLTLPKFPDNIKITGTLLYLSMSEAKTFGPYAPNTIMQDICFNLAQEIWYSADQILAGKAALKDVSVAKGWHPLCDYCEWNSDCPHFAGVSVPEMEQDLLILKDLKAEKDELSHRIQAEEENLKKTFQGISPNGEWVNAVTQRFRIATCEGRKTLDKDKLLSVISGPKQQSENADDILPYIYKAGKPYERLMISNIN
jgi:hypothetical protein